MVSATEPIAQRKPRDDATSSATSDVRDEVMNVPAVATLLHVGRSAVYDLVGKNAIPHRRVGKHLRFSRASVMRWLEGR